MKDYIISCCSTADMPYEYFKQNGIPYVCFHFNINNKEYSDDLGKTIPFDEFYKMISDGAMPTTSQVNVEQYINFFSPALEEGKDILHISFSSGLSGSYQSSKIAKEELEKKFPDRKILIIDSLGASSGYGLIVDKALELKKAGKSIDEVYSFIEENKLNLHHWFFSTDLSHYRRGGRISATSAAVGQLLSICPLLNMDNTGHLKQRSKVRGKKKVIDEMLRMMETHAEDGINYDGKCFISHSACYDDAKILADQIESKFKNLNGKVMINYVGTVVGSHTGPGTVALFFFGDKRTE